ncbi:hypothetical protein SAMN05421830_102292 [Desulfomicrobium norvegicum]|uniref:Uncharacterized protein n=1 Tax=Desulfomicrobium norvegicum (strain DSM 1741 / NCIMB 8310) TaxID=52561 RepID=A0A8G2C198_DESNO|nr:hypothetical protein SAMN05421830_102292 [Desulfomicrobium norvegicum]
MHLFFIPPVALAWEKSFSYPPYVIKLLPLSL